MFHQVADLFHDLDMGMLPISVLFPYLPIPAHWARDRCVSALAQQDTLPLVRGLSAILLISVFSPRSLDLEKWLNIILCAQDPFAAQDSHHQGWQDASCGDSS